VSVPLPVTATAGAALAAMLLADVLSEALRRFALRRGFTDHPDPRKSHARPTPYLGGIAIAVGTLASGCALVPHWDRRVAVVVAAGAAVALLGLIDDIRSLNRLSRVLAEGIAASAVVACGGRIAVFGNWLDPVLTVLWIVVLTNSFNLLDNMDGAVAGIASASACFVAGTAYLAGEPGLALLLLALSAGCLGFLVHNWAPARIFMGDAGSLFIGFVISAAIVMIHLPGGPAARLAELFLFTFVATVDTCLVLISRPRAGISWLAAGTDHASHRLRRIGLSVRQVALTLFAVAVLSCLCAVLVACGRLPGVGTLAAATTVAVTLILLLLKVPAYAVPDEPRLAAASHTTNSGRETTGFGG
jgi:UDP-GlcNAc:undecaprenyl-phosphate GlcNAc-1-phosphate transferase